MKITNERVSALDGVFGSRPLLIGHRGYAGAAPENTLPSFQRGLEAGADLVELDSQLSRDGVLMVIHDATLDRTTDARTRWRRRRVAVRSTSAAEMEMLDAGSWFGPKWAGVRVPRLAEALEFIVSAGGVAVVERKSGEAADYAKLLRERGWVNKLIVISFDWSFLRELHKLEPEQVLGALGPPARLVQERRLPRMSRRLGSKWLERASIVGAKIVVWNRRVGPGAFAVAHRRGMKVWIYTIDEPGRARRLALAGADGIITNRVTLIRAALKQPAGMPHAKVAKEAKGLKKVRFK